MVNGYLIFSTDGSEKSFKEGERLSADKHGETNQRKAITLLNPRRKNNAHSTNQGRCVVSWTMCRLRHDASSQARCVVSGRMCHLRHDASSQARCVVSGRMCSLRHDASSQGRCVISGRMCRLRHDVSSQGRCVVTCLPASCKPPYLMKCIRIFYPHNSTASLFVVIITIQNFSLHDVYSDLFDENKITVEGIIPYSGTNNDWSRVHNI